ncbi:TylF/MycF/NovP-related O-methyltransferase [Nocardioides aequoreus]|uniref:TylF/MycF/NovP-related O-methyltransferase n=1 Tax=Nocardioides aequoreus TaxID=397278 RepID=UPI000A022633|nr:TylF/MycF/NovP-related O-methyltransferase [Nocardioides aequoreus]
MAQPIDRARRAVGAVRRRLPGGTATSGRSADGSTDGATEAELRTRLRAARRRLAKQQARSERLREELVATRDSLRDPFPELEVPDRVEQVIASVRAQGLSYLKAPDLRMLARVVAESDLSGREGAVLECGTARGGSAIVMAAAKGPTRPMRVYDVFGMIPPPSERDGEDVARRYAAIQSGAARGTGGETYYGYRDDLLGEVTRSFVEHGVAPEEHRVELVQGLFEDTVQVDGPVALAHLDGDWYESTMVCLERISPHLVPGGRLVIDDYYFWSGCRTAVDEYFAGREGYRLERRARLHVVRL